MNKRKRSRKIATLLFVMTLLVIAGIFAASVFLTDRYNRRVHQYTGTGDTLFTTADNKDARRVYRKKLTKEDITNEIEKNKGTQFDPKIADIFLKLLKEGKI